MDNPVRIEQKLDQLNEVFEQYPNIIAVIVFGSYNTPYYNQNSDIDFGIIYSVK
ncbi:MAG: nucleotidyltransferase domain-containing protein [Caldicoprobacter oshimai]|uniref:Nucleotidyltransferase domain-containing protein n=1 Tax=Caldicoprobacter faecalis TaxID=937334 RepID=A0A1I5UHP3_9FIRM|nr:nucleotidyltransferase domain-containing protein [Caldicoprobacter faecalis]PZN11867.1 MAG: nucleotidyltransferase domain-containing protein [Caldicoprobacter oshimai]SFP94782.1 Nucleotidyltransferase domain-containing protein [Caldicoprobacter faecalis]